MLTFSQHERICQSSLSAASSSPPRNNLGNTFNATIEIVTIISQQEIASTPSEKSHIAFDFCTGLNIDIKRNPGSMYSVLFHNRYSGTIPLLLYCFFLASYSSLYHRNLSCPSLKTGTRGSVCKICLNSCRTRKNIFFASLTVIISQKDWKHSHKLCFRSLLLRNVTWYYGFCSV